MAERAPSGKRLLQRAALEASCLLAHLARPAETLPVRAMGLVFPSPLGIAAGFDRVGRLGGAAARLGFGFNELGTFDLAALPPLRPRAGAALLGLNLALPATASTDALCRGLIGAWQQADYLMLNLMSPQTAALAADPPRLQATLAALRRELERLQQGSTRRVPLLAKLRCLPGRTPVDMAVRLRDLGFDGLLAAHDPGPPATRERYRRWQQAALQDATCAQLAELRATCGPALALLSVGGIQHAGHLQARLAAGADLVQVHSALLRRGPWLARALLRGQPACLRPADGR